MNTHKERERERERVFDNSINLCIFVRVSLMLMCLRSLHADGINSGMGDPNVPITIINQPIAAASAAPDDACCCKYKKPVYR